MTVEQCFQDQAVWQSGTSRNKITNTYSVRSQETCFSITMVLCPQNTFTTMGNDEQGNSKRRGRHRSQMKEDCGGEC